MSSRMTPAQIRRQNVKPSQLGQRLPGLDAHVGPGALERMTAFDCFPQCVREALNYGPYNFGTLKVSDYWRRCGDVQTVRYLRWSFSQQQQQYERERLRVMTAAARSFVRSR